MRLKDQLVLEVQYQLPFWRPQLLQQVPLTRVALDELGSERART